MKLNGRNYFGARMKYDSFVLSSVVWIFFIKFGFAVINRGINFVGNLRFLFVVKIRICFCCGRVH
jgi:hypothetical protein